MKKFKKLDLRVQGALLLIWVLSFPLGLLFNSEFLLWYTIFFAYMVTTIWQLFSIVCNLYFTPLSHLHFFRLLHHVVLVFVLVCFFVAPNWSFIKNAWYILPLVTIYYFSLTLEEWRKLRLQSLLNISSHEK